MKNITTFSLIAMLVFGCKNKVEKSAEDISSEPVAVMDDTTQKEWTLLFDGTSLDSWQAFQGGEPLHWKIEDKALVLDPPTPEERKKTDGSGNKSFNIVTKKAYTSFVLSLEWKIAEGGNSGILWGVSEDKKFSEPYQSGLEIQVLDNEKHPDAKNGTTHQAGALYDLVEPSEDVTKPIGQWNTAVLTVNQKTNSGSSVLNGVEVAAFPVNGAELDALIKGSKFDGWDGFAKFQTGKIGLQDHGDVVAFRNIKIKEL